MALRTTALTKSYGRIRAVDGLDLEVAEGARFGFLGPNGSGKTTTVRMLLGLVYATSGTVEVLGRSMPRGARRVLPEIGALVEGPAFPAHLSGRRALGLLDAAGPGGPRRSRRGRVEQALGEVGLDAVDSRPVRAYSLGMRQRLGLAAALLRRPRLLVLDEPTNGLDPAGIREIRDLLRRLNEGGTTVFLSSHLLSEVQDLCTDVAVVDRGRLVVADRTDRLLTPTGRLLLRTRDAVAAADLLGTRPRSADEVVISGLPAEEVARRCVAAGLAVEELIVERRSMEDVFLELTSGGTDRRSASPGLPR